MRFIAYIGSCVHLVPITIIFLLLGEALAEPHTGNIVSLSCSEVQEIESKFDIKFLDGWSNGVLVKNETSGAIEIRNVKAKKNIDFCYYRVNGYRLACKNPTSPRECIDSLAPDHTEFLEKHGAYAASKTCELSFQESRFFTTADDANELYGMVQRLRHIIDLIRESGGENASRLMKFDREPFRWLSSLVIVEGDRTIEVHYISALFTNDKGDAMSIEFSINGNASRYRIAEMVN